MRSLALLVALGACADDNGPRLVGVEPGAASRGAMVTLTGQRLCGTPANCAAAGGHVQIGLDPPVVQAIVTEYAETRAVIVVPTVAPVGETALVVTVNERASNALAFEVLP